MYNLFLDYPIDLSGILKKGGYGDNYIKMKG